MYKWKRKLYGTFSSLPFDFGTPIMNSIHIYVCQKCWVNLRALIVSPLFLWLAWNYITNSPFFRKKNIFFGPLICFREPSLHISCFNFDLGYKYTPPLYQRITLFHFDCFIELFPSFRYYSFTWKKQVILIFIASQT